MIRTILVDDETLAREHLRRILSEHPDVEVLSEAANGFQALEEIGEHLPDVVFLDIEMPGFNGFEVVQNLVEPPLIVFATAYDEYAVRAFEANAIDYLLKPIQPDRVSRSLERIRSAIGSNQKPPAESLRRLMKDLGPERIPPRTKLAARKGKRIVVLPFPEITHIGIEEKLTFVYTEKDRYLSDKSVGELAESLEEHGFFRISRAELLNLDCVRELIPWFSGPTKQSLRAALKWT